MLKTKKLLTLFLISLIITMPFSVSVFAQEEEPEVLPEEELQEEVLPEETAEDDAQESSGPEIIVEIPAYAGSDRIDIAGTSEIETTVYLYINGAKQRKFETKDSIDFSFNNVELSAFSATTLKVEAVSSEGSRNSKSFEITVDKESPVIKMDSLPSVAKEPEITVKADITELCFVNMTLNNEILLSAPDIVKIEESVALEEGENIIKILASDRAGNKAEIEHSIFMDTTPPEISNLTPESGAFFYETDPVTDIEGVTEPLSEVVLYKEYEDDKGELKTYKVDSVTADENGRFEFKDVNLKSGQISAIAEGEAGYISGDVSSEGVYQPEYYGTQDEAEYEASLETGGEKDLEDMPADFIISVTDQAGLQTNASVSYIVGTCFSENMDWNIINMVEYQAPTTLSAERLADGTELISFVVNMTYQGLGEVPIIKEVSFERACDADSMLSDKKYNYSCKVLPSKAQITKHNELQTLWYIRFNLNKLEGLNKLPENPFEELGKSFVFPLKIRVTYTHEINKKETSELQQVRCMDFAYAVDTSKINAKKVFPDWLRKDGMTTINNTITKLNDYIDKIDKVVQVVAVACIVGFALKVLTIIYRRWQAWSDYFDDKNTKNDDKNEKCPEPGNKINPEVTMRLNSAKDTPLQQGATQADLTDEQLEQRCPKAKAAWESEQSAYAAYRWACDRFLCKGTPAAWTASTDLETIRQRTASSLLCTSTTSTKGTVLKKPDTDTCTKMTKLYSECWEYQGAYYSVTDRSEKIDDDKEVTYWSGKTGLSVQKGDVVLTKAPGTGGFSSLSAPNEIVVTEESGNALIREDKDCVKDCNKKGWSEGKCFNSDGVQFQSEVLDKNIANTPNKDVTCPATAPGACICYGTKSASAEIDPPGDNKDDWNYRYDKVGYFYAIDKYYKARDQSACFGLNNLLTPGAPYLSPKDFVPALQCLCTTQIRARMILIRNILQGLYNCLQQIDKTGEANAGVCKEIFTQYVCRWIYKIIAYLMKGCLSLSSMDKDSFISDKLKQGTDSLFGGVEESTSDLMEDYDNAAIENYLGSGEGAVVEKVCLGALTGDWGLSLDDVIDSAYTAPYHTSAAAVPASREYITFNPDNEMAMYEYSLAWMIAPGCPIDSYTVSLVCATDYEIDAFDNVGCTTSTAKSAPGGCDCSSLAGSRLKQDGSETPEQLIYRSSESMSQGTFVDMSMSYNAESLYRYDNVKITIYVNDPKVAKECIPEKNLVGTRMGVFYSPIKDQTVSDIVACRFDQSTATFRCDQGELLWESKGRAWFGSIECDSKTECPDKVYYAGEQLLFSKFEAYTKGAKHCLYTETKNGLGQKIYSGTITLESDNSNPTNITYHNNPPNLLNGVITSANFGSIAEQHTIAASAHSRREEQADGTIVDGTYYVYFIDNNPEDNKGVGDTICYGGTTGDILKDCPGNNDFKTFTDKSIIQIGGMGFRFENPEVSKTSSCSTQYPNCAKYSLSITGPKARTDVEDIQDWKIHLELRHAPGDESQGSCAESQSKDVVIYQGEKQAIDITTRVSSKTRAESRACKGIGDYNNRNDEKCDCDGDSIIGQVPPDGKDCDGKTYQYCLSNTCWKNPVCLPSNQQNTQNCDCDISDTLDELGDKDGVDCQYRYCWTDGTCKNFAQSCFSVDKVNTKNCDCDGDGKEGGKDNVDCTNKRCLTTGECLPPTQT